MIIDGRAIAKDVVARVKEHTKQLSFVPKLGVVTCAPGVETKQYLELKTTKAKAVGIELVVLELPSEATTTDCIEATKRLAHDCHGILVQLPLPSHIDRDAVLSAVPNDKDADGFSYLSHNQTVLPPVVGAIEKILHQYNLTFTDKHVVVVGDGRLVGQPAYRYATERATKVTLLKEDSTDYNQILRDADVLISGVGQPHFITKDMVKEGVMVFDAGASEDGGVVVGDVHPEVANKASLFTPVPGGVGPITVAVLLSNVLTLCTNRTSLDKQ
jgi:methylenetetrahydrofolate dehydrogenase (NADP+)/methenyltetrahydrofolate cyclohydrolase